MEDLEQPIEQLEGAQSDCSEGSNLGKFKDATSLLNAYQNLQAEFTRKSQQLAELKKQTDELTNDKKVLSKTENSSVCDISENSSCDNKPAQFDDFDAILSKKLLKFAENNPTAINCIGDIKQEIIENNQLLNLSNGLEIAYRLTKEKQKCEPAEIVTNPEYIEKYILNNSAITNTIVNGYIKSLAKKESYPKLISGNSANVVATPSDAKPKTLSDANKILCKMLEK